MEMPALKMMASISSEQAWVWSVTKLYACCAYNAIVFSVIIIDANCWMTIVGIFRQTRLRRENEIVLTLKTSAVASTTSSHWLVVASILHSTSVGSDKGGANKLCIYELGIDPVTYPFFSSAEGSPHAEKKKCNSCSLGMVLVFHLLVRIERGHMT